MQRIRNLVTVLLLSIVFTPCSAAPFQYEYKKRPKTVSNSCTSLKVSVLKQLHGGAFNSVYMRFDEPDPKVDQLSVKRAADMSGSKLPVLFNPTTNSSKPTTYAWEVLPEKQKLVPRSKRNRDGLPWDCGEVFEWFDLGMDYFPRYLKYVTCSCSSCWYKAYKCVPRHFPVNVLRKVGDECIQVPEKLQTYLEVNDKEYVEPWIWDEIRIPVSCECLP